MGRSRTIFLAIRGITREHDRNVQAFLEGMRALGYVEGQNLVVEYRGAAGQYERFPALAAELVRLPVDVLLAGVRQRRWPPRTRPRRSPL
jgi:hypothetical protein